MAITHNDDLIQLQIETSPAESADLAANGAPAGEPETWDETVPNYNPLFGRTPESEPIAVSPELAATIDDRDHSSAFSVH